MAMKYAQKQHKQNSILYTITAVLLVCAVFFAMVVFFYAKAEADATETLHVQTKQIKDDIHLQMISDGENLSTMAAFAAKLHRDGEPYDLMFESFKPIGLIANIGILGPDNVFRTKAGYVDLNGRISFAEEAAKGAYVSGRVEDLTRDGYEIVRSAVPINVDGETVGVLYGVIKLDALDQRYNEMAQNLDAQLFVYDREKGQLIIDTVHDELGNISFLKDRRYNDGYSYEQMMATENGFTSFMSAYRPESVHLHYSTIDDLGWMIALVRYDSQVFAETHELTQRLTIVFGLMVAIMSVYIWMMMRRERKLNAVTETASDIRKTLLETAEHQNHMEEALKQVLGFAQSRSAIFFDTDGVKLFCFAPGQEGKGLSEEERIYFNAELLKYADEMYRTTGASVNVMCITPNFHLRNTNPAFCRFLAEHTLFEVTFAAITSNSNHTAVVGVLNPKNGQGAKLLMEKVAVCFSIAFNNKKHLDKTERAATTDALTGALNRVAYNHMLEVLDAEKPLDFACIYVDVNELHLVNNTFGHSAGDEMLRYIANTLKEVFYGQMVYRLGGDEFLVFVRNMTPDAVQSAIGRFTEQLEPKHYHTAIGMSYRTQNTNTDDMVKEAEMRMYEAKAQYYQDKETKSTDGIEEREYVRVNTGVPELDALLQIMKEEYDGICRVHLDSDCGERILLPAYLGYSEREEHFSALFSKYVSDKVEPDQRRAMLSFLNYDSIKHQLDQGLTPKITYKKAGGKTAVLRVYSVGDSNVDTLWVFAKD